MKVYLDNAATTRCSDKATDAAMKALKDIYGNPSSLHNMGMDAENLIKEARSYIAKSLKAKEKEIVFTSGGTESNNLAISGGARAKRRQGKHIISTMIEHPSVHNPIVALQDEGYEASFLPVDNFGRLRLSALEESIREDTVLVSIMHVNNEIGTIQPVLEAAKIVHDKAPRALFHVDAVQSFGKLSLCPQKLGIDLLSVSGHKLHAPKGSGFLYIREGVHILPILYGGGQEFTLRSGTENVPAIAGLSSALKVLFEEHKGYSNDLHSLRRQFIEKIEEIDGITVNGSQNDEDMAPHIVSVSATGIRSEVLLHALEDKGVFVSAGSACSSNRPAKSRTLQAIGVSNEALDSTIRFSFSYETTGDELDYAADVLKDRIGVLRKFKRR